MIDRRLIVFPYWSDNPYLNMLYLAARAQGWRLSGSTLLESLLAAVDTAADGDVVHLHWTRPIVQRAEDQAQARMRLDDFCTAMDAALGRGVRLIWTVHNKLPHELQFHAEEIELAEYLAHRAHSIHIMSEGTAAVVADEFSLPLGKAVRVPHSSYVGVYDQSLSRDAARAAFGLGDDELAVLFFGQMRPYKGLDVLLEAVERAALAGTKLVLLLAGKTFEDDRDALERAMPSSVRVVREHSYIDDDAIQDWYAAADLAVLPYRDVLNSGSAHLAATFGVPTVLPGLEHLRADFQGEDWVIFFNQEESVESLVTVLTEFDRHAVGLRASAEAFAAAYTPFDMSRAYARMLADVVSGGVPSEASSRA